MEHIKGATYMGQTRSHLEERGGGPVRVGGILQVGHIGSDFFGEEM